MNILYIAYSCNPYQGSEDKIGWQIPWESSRWNQVYVITKEEQRPFVERYLKEHPRKNLHFFYVDIPSLFKKIYKGFFYSGRLNIWHRHALPVAKKICKENDISIIHQITPIEFRAIGNYGSIPGVKFVCGPVGGGEFVPEGLRCYLNGHRTVEFIRKAANMWSKYIAGTAAGLSHCDAVLFANRETKVFLCSEKAGEEYAVMPEIAIESEGMSDQTPNGSCTEKKCTFLIAGRMIYRKGHAFLVDALAGLPDHLEYECRIVGNGPEADSLHRRCMNSPYLSEHIVFKGNVPYEQMQQEYADADVLIMPSIRETTGTVLLEAMSHGLPVITINRFGAQNIVDDSTGWVFDGSSKESFLENLRLALIACISQPEEILRRGANARLRANDFTWEKKVRIYQGIYDKLCDTE